MYILHQAALQVCLLSVGFHLSIFIRCSSLQLWSCDQVRPEVSVTMLGSLQALTSLTKLMNKVCPVRHCSTDGTQSLTASYFDVARGQWYYAAWRVVISTRMVACLFTWYAIWGTTTADCKLCKSQKRFGINLFLLFFCVCWLLTRPTVSHQ